MKIQTIKDKEAEELDVGEDYHEEDNANTENEVATQLGTEDRPTEPGESEAHQNPDDAKVAEMTEEILRKWEIVNETNMDYRGIQLVKTIEHGWCSSLN